jgi:transketolase N-terminal domain/subunit
MYSAKKVDNLIATIDLNGKQIDGSTDEVLAMGSIRAKFEALTGMLSTLKKETTSKLLLLGTMQNLEQEKESQFVFCIPKWVMELIL